MCEIKDFDIVDGVLMYYGGDETNLLIPSGVTEIGGEACCFKNIERVIIGDSVSVIGWRAFHGCIILKSVSLGSGVNYIEQDAFSGCGQLESLTVDSGNATYRSEGNCIIETAAKTLVLGCKNSVIPLEVTSIGDYAFEDCESLKSIYIPESVTSIGRAAFYGCESLSGITVSSDNGKYRSEGNCLIETAAKKLVLGCKNSVIPLGVTAVGDWAFSGQGNLTDIAIPSGVKTIGEGAFHDCGKLERAELPSGLNKIGENAFAYCKSLKSITIPESVKRIGGNAFCYCENLTEITFCGTEEQWEKIKKGKSWDYGITHYTLRFSKSK